MTESNVRLERAHRVLEAHAAWRAAGHRTMPVRLVAYTDTRGKKKKKPRFPGGSWEAAEAYDLEKAVNAGFLDVALVLSNIVQLDFDPRESEGEEEADIWDRLTRTINNYELNGAYQSKTGRGYQAILRAPPGTWTRTVHGHPHLVDEARCGTDANGHGLLAFVWPSWHPVSEKYYEPFGPIIPVAELPVCPVELLAQPEQEPPPRPVSPQVPRINTDSFKNGRGDWTTLDIVALFQSAGLYLKHLSGRKHGVTCPWHASHTQGGDGTDTAIFEAHEFHGPGFECMHAHCTGRTIRDVREFFGTETVDSHCAARFRAETATNIDNATAIADAIVPESTADEPPAPMLARLPDTFWTERAVLSHIKQAAHARNRAADAVFYCVLARVAAFRPPAASIDTGIGAPATLDLLVALVDPSGAGKSSPPKIARRLIPKPYDYDLPDPVPIGTGEGLAEAYMGWVSRRKEDGSKERVHAQVRYHCYAYVDEGAKLTALLERNGATIGETLRRAWQGETLGSFNATQDRIRVVTDYSIGAVFAFQPTTALPILDDHAAGTPQRFLWSCCTDPTVPDIPPDWPGELPIDLFGTFQPYTIDPDICTELRQKDTARVRGQLQLSTLDGHAPLNMLKIAGLLATLENRTHVNAEDWRLASIVWDTSCKVRNALVNYNRTLARSRARHTAREAARTAVTVSRAVQQADADTERVARRFARKVRQGGTYTARELQQHAGRDGKHTKSAIAYAVRKGWLSETDGAYTAGEVEP